VLVWLFLALLLRATRARVSAAASTLRMLAAAHLPLMLAAAHTHHLLLVMLRIHLLLTMHHLLIHGILAVTGAAMFDSFVVLPGVVSSNVLVVAVKIFSLVFVSTVLDPTCFAVFFTAYSCSLTLMFAKFLSSSCSGRCSCDPDFLCAFALAKALVFVE
jgi:hypothetical protein